MASVQRILEEVTESKNDRGGGWKVKKEKKENHANSLSTDFSTLTLNTTASGGKSGGYSQFPLCKWCSLFHELAGNGKCPFWDVEKKIFKITAFLKHRGVRNIMGDGSSKVSEYWIKKLNHFTFPNLKITDEETKKKIINDLRKAAQNLARATPAEMEQHAKNSQTFVSLATTEDKYNINLLKKESDLMVNTVKLFRSSGVLQKTADQAKKDKAKRRKARKENEKADQEEEEEEDSEEEDSESSDGDDD
jgi:hypothetical protein